MELRLCRAIISLVFIALVIVPIPVSAGTWSQMANIPTPRGNDCGVGIVDGIMYCIGGSGAGAWAVEAYDPDTNTWSRKADLPVARRAMKTEVVDGIIYSLAGELQIQNPETKAWIRTFYTDVFAYDPATDTWTRRADSTDTAAWFGSCVLNGEIYIVGGWWQQRTNAFFEVYNPISDTWRSLSPPGSQLINSYGGQAAATLDGKIYILGGWNRNDGRVHIYDPESGIVTEGPAMSTPTRQYPAAITLDEKMYILGSSATPSRMDMYNPFAAPPARQVRDVEVKDKLIMEWGTLKITE